MISRKIRRSDGFQRISGRTVRASDADIGLDDFMLEVIEVEHISYVREFYDKMGGITEGLMLNPKEAMNYMWGICEKSGQDRWTCKAYEYGDGGYIVIRFYQHKGYGVMNVYFRVIMNQGVTGKISKAMNSLS